MVVKVVLRSGHIILCNDLPDPLIAEVNTQTTVRLHDVSLYMTTNDPMPIRTSLMEVWTREIEAVSAD